jgi:hypothetical protein
MILSKRFRNRIISTLCSLGKGAKEAAWRRDLARRLWPGLALYLCLRWYQSVICYQKFVSTLYFIVICYFLLTPCFEINVDQSSAVIRWIITKMQCCIHFKPKYICYQSNMTITKAFSHLDLNLGFVRICYLYSKPLSALAVYSRLWTAQGCYKWDLNWIEWCEQRLTLHSQE